MEKESHFGLFSLSVLNACLPSVIQNQSNACCKTNSKYIFMFIRHSALLGSMKGFVMHLLKFFKKKDCGVFTGTNLPC
jgi:hypothetical protein